MKRTELSTIGEFGLIDRITAPFKSKQPTTIFGVGDDAAVIDNGNEYTVLSTDMLVEGIHFDFMYTPLKHLGYKAVVVNLSDVYAMNGTPRQIVVSIALSNRFSAEGIEELYEGIRAACEFYSVDLVGGDTTSSLKGFALSVTVLGTVKKESVTYRKGAQVGDILCVTGDLGGAYLGLQILEREKKIFLENPGIQPELAGHDYVIGRQLKPEARKDIIEMLETGGIIPTSMIDISDGLASEVMHICKASGVGAIIEEALVPFHNDTYELAAMTFNIDPITCALHGGEDYELLFTISPKDVDKIRYMMDIKIIGEIIPAVDGIRLQTKAGTFHDITAQGWNHFAGE